MLDFSLTYSNWIQQVTNDGRIRPTEATSHVIFPVAVVYLQLRLCYCITVVDCSNHRFLLHHQNDSNRQATGKESSHLSNRNGLLLPSEEPLRSSHVATPLRLYSTKQQSCRHWCSSYVTLRDKLPEQQQSFGYWNSGVVLHKMDNWCLHIPNMRSICICKCKR